jgi:PBP1b-binding outer membrane lipoprotein LpoB
MPKYLTISAPLSPQTSAPAQAHPTSPLHPLNRPHRDHHFHLFTANAAEIPHPPALPLPKQSPATYCPLGSSSAPNPPAATSISTGTPISDATTLPSTSPRRSSFFALLKAVIARVTHLVEVKAAVLVHAKTRWKSTFALFIKRASKRNNMTHMKRMTTSLSKLKINNDKNDKTKKDKKKTRRSSTLLACFRSPMVRNWSHTFMAIMAFLELRYPFTGIRFWLQDRADDVSRASSWRTGS